MSKEKVNYTLPTKNIWFPDQIEPLYEDKDKFRDYWRREKDRCINGFKIADEQVYIPGWLYFYTVYWMIERDELIVNPVTGMKYSKKTRFQPRFRDNEWLVAHDLLRCREEQKIYPLIGSRGFGKSYISSSVIGYHYTFFEDSENLVTGGIAGDIFKLNEKVKLGLDNIHPVFFKQRIKNDWRKEVVAGWVDKNTGVEKGSRSRILVRNYREGLEPDATNGTRPLCQIIEESGKFKVLQCVLDSIPSWMNEYGMFCLPILIGTGGDLINGEDLEKIFNNPELYGALAIPDPHRPGHFTGRFIPVTMARDEYKEDWTLYRFLTEKYPEQYKDLKPHPDLDIIIRVSNEEKCLAEFVEPRRERAMKSTSLNEIIKEKAYYPIKAEECFLSVRENDYPIEAAKEHEQFIINSGFKPVRVELYQDSSGQLKHKYTDKGPVSDFPVTANSDKEGVIEIVEFPIKDAPWGTYCAGLDPYKADVSNWSDSIGSVVIWKRHTDDMTEKYQNMPVAWYHGRPSNQREFYERVRFLLKFYNATCMMEAQDAGFKDYMEGLNELHYLAKGQSFLKEISPNSKFQGTYGLPATTQTITHWNRALISYTKEELPIIEEGQEEKKVLGVKRILDIMTLREMQKYDGKINTDRLRATSIACAYARQLDASLGTAKITKKEEPAPQRPITSPFALNSKNSGFMKSKSNITKSPFSLNTRR